MVEQSSLVFARLVVGLVVKNACKRSLGFACWCLAKPGWCLAKPMGSL